MLLGSISRRRSRLVSRSPSEDNPATCSSFGRKHHELEDDRKVRDGRRGGSLCGRRLVQAYLARRGFATAIPRRRGTARAIGCSTRSCLATTSSNGIRSSVEAPAHVTFAAAMDVSLDDSMHHSAILEGRGLFGAAPDNVTPRRSLIETTKALGWAVLAICARPRNRDGRGHPALGAQRSVSRSAWRPVRELRRARIREDRVDTPRR